MQQHFINAKVFKIIIIKFKVLLTFKTFMESISTVLKQEGDIQWSLYKVRF